MLAIRMQRTGRKGHAMYRMIVQDSRRTPTSGRIVALIGHHDPHAKTTQIVKDKAAYYLQNGAQPSPRAVRLLQAEGVTLPSWVQAATVKSSAIRNQSKLRRNQPAAEAPVEAELPTAEAPTDKVSDVATADEATESPASPTDEQAAADASDKAVADTPDKV